MGKREIAACILSDPVNIRYATDARNMHICQLARPVLCDESRVRR